MDPSCKLPKLFEGVFPTGSFWNNVLNVYAVAYLVLSLIHISKILRKRSVSDKDIVERVVTCELATVQKHLRTA